DTKSQIMNNVKSSIDGARGRILTVYGHGSAHKLTYGLCKHVADKRSDGYVYYHFDQHGDVGHVWTKISSGGFVSNLFNDTKAQDVIFSEESDFNRRALARGMDMSDEELRKLINQNATDAYCSFDLDCMRQEEIKTGWAGGWMYVDDLVEKIEKVNAKRRIISADILGYSGARDPKSHLTYAIAIEKLIGGDRIGMLRMLHGAAKTGKMNYEDMMSEFKLLGHGHV
ncbi:MAG: hypothetical protein V1731_01270, partial [Candidatus Aenigmatarchaeota archaeon]